MPKDNMALAAGELRSVNDLLSLVRTRHWEKGHYVYRGEDSAEYVLRPKIGRYRFRSEENLWVQENAVFREFRRRTLPHLSVRPMSDIDWLALAQHHGLATRLLDWSDNVLVAGYFAVRGVEKAHDRVLYALRADKIRGVPLNQDPFESPGVRIYRPTHTSGRISAQASAFSVHNRPSKAFESKWLERWIIPADCAFEIELMLNQIGINGATVFPGLDGIALHINETHLFRTEA